MIGFLAKLYKNIILILFVFTLVVGNLLIGSAFPDCDSVSRAIDEPPDFPLNPSSSESKFQNLWISSPSESSSVSPSAELCESSKRLFLFYFFIFNISVLLTYGAIATIIDINDNLKKLVNKE